MNPSAVFHVVAECRKSRTAFWVAWSWVAFVLGYYFWSIGPALDLIPAAFNTSAFSVLENSQALMVFKESFLIALTTSFILLVTISWGRQVRLFFFINPSDAWLRWGMEFGLGIVFLDMFWLGSGLVRVWTKPFFATMGILLSALVFQNMVDIVRGASHLARKVFPRDASYFFLFAAGAIYLFFSIAHGLVPETFYDSMVYHLAVPQYWLLKHGICDFPTNFFSNYPYGGELFYFNGFVFRGTEAAKMLHSAAFGFCALFAGGWAREIGGEKGRWLTLGLVLTLPLFAINIWSTQVEGILALALILFLYFSYHGLKDKNPSAAWVTATGLFMALAFSIKYTAALMVAGSFLAMILVQPEFLRRFRSRHWIGLFFGAVLLLGPWILKNFIFTGNPFFPYFAAIFDGRHLTLESYQKLLTEQQGRIAHGWEWLYLPWKAVMANPDGFDFSGPVALAFIPFLFLFKLRHPALRFISLTTGFFFLSGFLVTHILRFLGTGFILIYVLLGGVFAGGNRPHWGKILALAAGVSAILSFGYLSAISARYSGCAGVWFGHQSRTDYLESRGKITPYFSMARWISLNTPQDSGLLIVGDARGLYYDRPFLTNSVFDEQELAVLAREEINTQGIGRRLKQMGVDYLVVNGPEGIRVSSDYHLYDLTPEEWKRLDDFIQQNTEIVYQRNYQIVYHLVPSSEVKNSPEVFDLILFFSKPASEFIKAAQGHQWEQAGESLNEALKLYPFSEFWRAQKTQFDKAMGDIRPS